MTGKLADFAKPGSGHLGRAAFRAAAGALSNPG